MKERPVKATKVSINHLFMGYSWMLVSQMIEKIQKHSAFCHHFIIVVDSIEQEKDYLELFNRTNSSFEFWYDIPYHSSWKNFLKAYWYYLQLLSSGIFIRFKSIKKYILLYGNIKHFNSNSIIIHSEINDLDLLFLTTKIHLCWCCWGGIPQTYKFTVLELFKKRYYVNLFLKRCDYIVTLTDSDRNAFLKIIPNVRVIQTSYSYIYNYEDICNANKISRKILVGNSAFYIDDYTKIVEILKKYKGLDITFMCSYGIDLFAETFIDWERNTNDTLKYNHIHYWKRNLNIDDYNKELASYRVYIAPMQRQSGLGAITTALAAGVKCYLTGVNYDYFIRKGLTVFKIEELYNSTVDDIIDWDNDEANRNIKLCREVCSVERSILEWEEIYSDMNVLERGNPDASAYI